MHRFGGVCAFLAATVLVAQIPTPVHTFISANCMSCHNAQGKAGNLDLTSFPFDIKHPANFAEWVKIHDRVRDGEMPPVKLPGLTPAVRESFTASLAAPLIAADRARYAAQGRSTWRRMNRYEYENTLRDLLGAPWLQIKDMLPEDGEAFKYNKVGDALDVSHVQMIQYLAAAEYALREVLPKTTERPMPVTKRYYAREQNSFFGGLRYPDTNARDTFPVIGYAADIPLLKKTGVRTAGAAKPEMRELEGIGVIASSYEPIELHFNQFKAPVAGRYKLRLNAHTMWVGPLAGEKWWKPDPENISMGRTHEPVTIYSELPPRQMRRLGTVDVHPEASVSELDVYLLKGETIRVDASRFFRSRPPGDWHNPLATKEGQPGVSFRWLEATGPLVDEWPTEGQKLLFGDLPFTTNTKGGAEFTPKNAAADSKRLVRNSLQRAYRHPVPSGDVDRFTALAAKATASGLSFTDAMITTCSAVLCSPAFVTLEEKPGKLDSYAMASRLSYFLWNSEPDATLRELAAHNKLQDAAVLRAQTKRLLEDPKSQRFVQAFLDYWLDLRKLNNTSPDSNLYPDYYLDDLLVESAGDETRAFFTELLGRNLPARNIVSSDFSMLNERLAAHYGIPGVAGVALRSVPLPADSPRGGILTQASILKVTANGTTTSPVLRGVWISERILGHPVPPPPAGVPPVDPDTRGATTIREQLAKHRSQTICKSCHAKIDPAGFALENFDIAGGWRDRYRALGDAPHAEGIGKAGHEYEFHYALPVDSSGTLPDGRSFADIRELKKLLLTDERQLARNLASQLITYSTGAPVRFGDRPALEKILDRARGESPRNQYGVESIVESIVQSDLFRSK